jgi:hypothetical protein
MAHPRKPWWPDYRARGPSVVITETLCSPLFCSTLICFSNYVFFFLNMTPRILVSRHHPFGKNTLFSPSGFQFFKPGNGYSVFL